MAGSIVLLNVQIMRGNRNMCSSFNQACIVAECMMFDSLAKTQAALSKGTALGYCMACRTAKGTIRIRSCAHSLPSCRHSASNQKHWLRSEALAHGAIHPPPRQGMSPCLSLFSHKHRQQWLRLPVAAASTSIMAWQQSGWSNTRDDSPAAAKSLVGIINCITGRRM